MVFEKRHKTIFTGANSLLIVFMVVTAVLFIMVFYKQQTMYDELNAKFDGLQADTNSKISDLSNNLITTRDSLTQDLSSLNSQVSDLKVSVSEDFSGVIEDAVKGVLTVRTNVGQGTGFLITDDGYFVTNAHVLEGGNKIEAITSEQDVVGASLVGYDGNLDVALLKLSGNGDYSALTLADSEDVQVGEKVIAIGNPLGLQFSVSQGIVSGVKRQGSNGLKVYIQTDAALNPGNSGGPLINKEGEVIGINNFKIGDSENLGFALESNYIKAAVNKIYLDATNKTLI